MTETARGACLCGAVRFSTHGKIGRITACHCSQCRKQSGHYWAATHVLEDELVIEGGENLTWYVSTPGYKRGFCKTCGSALFWQQDGSCYISMSAGTLESPTQKLVEHIYCADKGDYYEITDGLPQYAKGRDYSMEWSSPE